MINRIKQDKKGVWFLSSWMLAGFFAIISIVAVVLLVFNQNIKEAVAVFVSFMNTIKIYLFIGFLLFIGYKTGILQKVWTATMGILKI